LIELSGEKGQIVGDHAHGFVYLIKGLERKEFVIAPPLPTVRETLKAFVDGVQRHTPFPITVDDGVQAVAIAEACYRSAERKEQGIAVERVVSGIPLTCN